MLSLVLDLSGVFVFALAGALAAVRARFDVIGLVVVAMVSSIGGGLLRDVLLGTEPPLALRDWKYLAVPTAAAGLAWWLHPRLARLRRSVRVADAFGLGFFSVSGTATALAAGLAPPSACLLGVLTGVGGGVIRDVLLREVPLVLSDGQFYALAALAGALLVAVTWHLQVYGLVAAGAGVALVVALRLLTLRLRWQLPVPADRRPGRPERSGPAGRSGRVGRARPRRQRPRRPRT
ncbi:trimeric intracellular cation channel family protein [Pseudokineococcus marinus]|uniref:Trimeric intracellular cation channel family protein n=1 Tax=Pseudokineococcus marinus TaxID=351215 RepID=A0A849BKG1_9ACTN|nr:trimeric intracellular cation channel family protein [Pseudokineococcus marinus]